MTRTTPLSPALRARAGLRRRGAPRHVPGVGPRDVAVLEALDLWSTVRHGDAVRR